MKPISLCFPLVILSLISSAAVAQGADSMFVEPRVTLICNSSQAVGFERGSQKPVGLDSRFQFRLETSAIRGLKELTVSMRVNDSARWTNVAGITLAEQPVNSGMGVRVGESFNLSGDGARFSYFNPIGFMLTGNAYGSYMVIGVCEKVS